MTRSGAAIPSVDIVIPAYNASSVLTRAIHSCQRQTVPVHEIMVVDDASEDSTSEVASPLAAEDPRIRLIRLSSNQGPQAARFAGVRASTAEWIAFLDADDELLPDSLETRLAAAGKCGFRPALIYGDVYFGEAGERRMEFKRLAGHVYETWLTKELSLSIGSALMVRRDCFQVTGYPSLDLPAGEDQDLMVTIGRSFPVLHSGGTVAIRHLHANQISRQSERMIQGCRLMMEKYRREMLRYHGPLCLLFWRLRLASLQVISYTFGRRERHRALVEACQGRYTVGRVCHALYCRGLKKIYSALRAILRLYFSNLPEAVVRPRSHSFFANWMEK